MASIVETLFNMTRDKREASVWRRRSLEFCKIFSCKVEYLYEIGFHIQSLIKSLFRLQKLVVFSISEFQCSRGNSLKLKKRTAMMLLQPSLAEQNIFYCWTFLFIQNIVNQQVILFLCGEKHKDFSCQKRSFMKTIVTQCMEYFR